jgi:hypothetical protein
MSRSTIFQSILPLFNRKTATVGANHSSPFEEKQTVDMPVTAFHTIALNFDANVRIIQTDQCRVTITAPASIIDHILQNSFVQNGQLLLRHPAKEKPLMPIQIAIALPHLKMLKITGDSEIHSVAPLAKCALLEIQSSGDAKFFLAFAEAGNLQISATGDSYFLLDGNAHTVQYQLSGDAIVEACDLSVHHCRIQITGDAKCHVAVQNSLHVKIRGDGDVRYCGQPSVHTSIRGDGRVKAC